MLISRLDVFQQNREIEKKPVSPSSFLQTPFWAEFKAEHGWKTFYFLLENPGQDSGCKILLTVLLRRFSRIASIAYIPMGPDIQLTDPKEQGKFLEELSLSLAPYLPHNTFCIRFDPPWGTSVPNIAVSEPGETEAAACTGNFPRIPAGSCRQAPAHIQPPDTVILDLSKPLEILLSEMKSKWRYNIKLAEKKGVAIKCLEGENGAAEGIDIFYALYIETAKRDGIAIHSKEYYRDLIKRPLVWKVKTQYDKPVSIRVYIALHETKPLASIITIFSGDEAVYLYGASSNEKRNLMPAYGLQWRAISDARLAGCTRYDFYGIPPSDNPSHPMHGLYRFKTGFGGTIFHRVGSLDIAFKPVFYELYRLTETARTFWYKKIIKFLRRETLQKS